MSSESERLRELLAISRTIIGTTDYEDALRLVVQKACAFTRADACLLLLAEPGAPATIAASVGAMPGMDHETPIVLDEQLVATLRGRFEIGPESEIVAVPMVLRGDVRGSLVVVRKPARDAERGATSPETDEFLLSALADQAAIALGHMAHLRELQNALAAAELERRAREDVLAALSAERSWLRAVIEHSPVAVLLVEGKSGERVLANARAEQLFGKGIDPEGGVEQYAEQICTADGTPLPHDEIPSIQALRGAPVRRELAIRHPSGTLVPVLVSAAAITERAVVLGAVVLYEDISVLKDLERLREEWTAVIAHDLRQPVNSISIRAQLLSRQIEAADPNAKRAIDHILTSTQRLSRMIDDLMESSLLQTQRLVLNRTTCDVSQILGEAIERSGGITEGHPVELAVAADLPMVDVDCGRIEQVLTNLLANAVKYGAAETPIEVRAEDHGDAIEVTVTNHGPGMDPVRLDTLFERFQRGHTMGPKGEGLGLGLYISKGLVEGHGGKIWVDTVPGRTTSFHFTMPTAARCSLETEPVSGHSMAPT